MIALLPGAPIGEVFTLLPHPTNLVLAELAQVHWPAGAWLVVSLYVKAGSAWALVVDV